MKQHNILARVNTIKYLQNIPFVYLTDSKKIKEEYETLKALPNGTWVAIIDDAFSSCCLSAKNHNNFLELPNIEKVIAENWVDASHEKLMKWPIGLESRMVKNKLELIKGATQTTNKNKEVLCNSHLATYRNPASGYRDDRNDMINQLRGCSKVDFWNRKKSQEETFKLTPDYMYNLCPEGNGLDTHRFYESYLLGSSPVVRKGPLTDLHSRFDNAVVVEEWKDVDKKDLPKPTKPFNKDMVTMGHWLYKAFRSRCRIVTFFTGGIGDEWRNLLFTLRKQGLEDLLVAFVLDEDAKKCVESENKEGKISIRTDFIVNELKSESYYGTTDFRNIMTYKMLSILKMLEEGYITYYIDTDVVVMDDIVRDYFNYPYRDLYYQPNNPYLINSESENICAGVMAIYPTENMKAVFKEASILTDDIKPGIGDDQTILERMIKSKKVKSFGNFDMNDYPNGLVYFQKYHHFKDRKVKLVHNNYIVGNRAKVERFKKFNLWFL